MNINDILSKEEFKVINKFLNDEMKKFADDELIKQMIYVWEEESIARNWFYSNAIGLGGKRPYDFCKEGRIQEVKDLLGQIDYGSAL